MLLPVSTLAGFSPSPKPTHDYTGNQNVNGAIFLDEHIKLRERPTCYILYGHNMKAKEMFGFLHQYDDQSFLQTHNLITFDTQYEEGQFAVFASGTVSLDEDSPAFVDYYNLPKATGEKRAAIVERLRQISNHQIDLDVAEDDQLLILITCIGDERERRFVAARRLRDGETADILQTTYLLAAKKTKICDFSEKFQKVLRFCNARCDIIKMEHFAQKEICYEKTV